jgi:DMSO/TMAO reductase YedYZ molybdopterin-dependent catalytic subunit
MRKSIQTLSVALLAFLLVSLSACSGGPKVDWDLKISGAVGNPLTLGYNELTDMPQIELSEVLMEKSMGEDEVTSWSGVALREIFERAEVDPDYVSVTATAADGYAIEISKDELQGAVVALKRGAEWIVDVPEEEGKGPIRLVCPETPANRWIFQLQEIQVNK